MRHAPGADARRNRRRLVETARLVFAERGLDAPLDEIARRADVGNATLYRHFPDRRELVAAVFVDAMQEIVDATVRSLEQPDPWVAFTDHLTFLCRLQATDRALANLLTATVSGVPELERLRVRSLQGVTRLIDRARASGDLRGDFRHEDVVLILMANAGPIDRTAATAPTAWRRHLSYVLAGASRPPQRAGGPITGEDAVVAAMQALADRTGARKRRGHRRGDVPVAGINELPRSARGAVPGRDRRVIMVGEQRPERSRRFSPAPTSPGHRTIRHRAVFWAHGCRQR